MDQDFRELGILKAYVYPSLVIFIIPTLSLAFFYHAQSKFDRDMLASPPDFTIAEGDEFEFGGHKIVAMHTPGHTPGGTCFLIGRHLFSGDTLFPGGPGNTKSAMGDFPQIIESIRTRLFTLPEDTLVYPGHGLDTTIGTEKPHLQEWIDRGW